MSDFDRFFPWLMKWEGEYYEDVPGDDGGPTKFGIDQESHPGLNIRGLSLDQARSIYQKEWNSCLSNDLKYPLGLVYFNYWVNSGPGRSNRLLQESLGLTPDGDIGPASKHAISQIKDFKGVSIKMVDASDSFYRSIAFGHNAKFLKGWLNRNEDLRKTFLA